MKRYRVYLLSIRTILGVIFSFFSLSTFASSDCAEPLKLEAIPLVKINYKNFEFDGLTAEGLTALKKARDSIRTRAKLFENEFRGLETVHHALMLTRLQKGNMLLYGPPGGAKSAVIDWILRGESEPSFQLQLHQMLTEMPFIGGQNFDEARKGQFLINTKGSLSDFVVGHVDEMEKGTPSALASLLSLLNERKILAGNQVIKARLETLFATSNANLPEIFQQFMENGQGSTAPALLNRFQFKAMVYNWLPLKDQAFLDEKRQHLRYLRSLKETHPEVLIDQHFLEPQPLAWATYRRLAHPLFKPTPVFMTLAREFVNDMREQTNNAIKESEERHKSNQQEEPFVYFPSTDYTERLRQQIPEVILLSAFLDFMMSPLADDGMIESLTKKQISLDPLSLWRAFTILTTIGPGEVKLEVNFEKPAIDIHFNGAINPSLARDRREELLVQNLKSEQERFRKTFLKHIGNMQDQIELRARNAKLRTLSTETQSFELLMKRYRGD